VPSDPNKLALIIGIDAYYNSDGLAPLPSCKKDANDLAELLSKAEFGYTIFKGRPLIGSQLNKYYGWVQFRQAIFDFFGEAKPGQKLLFYFSGHGIAEDNDVYMGTPQVDSKSPGFAGFSLSDLTKRMKSSKSKQILGIIDACYSGSTDLPNSRLRIKASKDTASRALAAYDRVWKRVPKAKGMYLLLSSQAYEPSNAIDGKNSLYTEYLLQGLRGVKPEEVDENGRIIRWSGSIEDNGDVTPSSLHEYVYHKVAKIADQVPQLKSLESSSFTIVIHPSLVRSEYGSQSQLFSIPGRIVVSASEVYRNDYIFESLHIFSAHNEVNGRSRAKIALITQGATDRKHDAFQQVKISQFSLDPLSEGSQKFDDTFTDYNTFVCGLLSSPLLKNNFIGVAPYSELLVYDVGSNAVWTKIQEAISEASRKKPQIIFVPLSSHGQVDVDEMNISELKNAIDSAVKLGITVICTVSNEGSSTPAYPSHFENVLSAAAIDAHDYKAAFSSYNRVDVCAPGVGVTSSLSNNKWGMMSGSSMAGCFVAGAVALMYTVNPNLTPGEVHNIIHNTSEKIDHKNQEYAGLLGAGRLNVCRALVETREKMKK